MEKLETRFDSVHAFQDFLNFCWSQMEKGQSIIIIEDDAETGLDLMLSHYTYDIPTKTITLFYEDYIEITKEDFDLLAGDEFGDPDED